MEKEEHIENITLNLSSEYTNVRVISNKQNLILSNQNIESVAELIRFNFNVVSNHYKLIIEKEKKEFNLKDINFISISIVLHYLYMYNSWKDMYRKQENKDLRFNDKDLSNPSTHDIVFNYFITKYPNEWEEKCAILLGMELNKLRTYYQTRESFYKK